MAAIRTTRTTVLATLAVILMSVRAGAQGSIETDQAALEALYHATDGPNWTSNDGWLTGTPATTNWKGVTTTATAFTSTGDPRVDYISLPGNNLNGGPLPATLGGLIYLTVLDLNNNNLSGPIPATLGQIMPPPGGVYLHGGLSYLALSYNNLSGPIPATLGQLADLNTLRLDHNNLSGPIPATLGQLTALRELDLSSNNLSGPIPAHLGNLTQPGQVTPSRDLRLHELDLGANNLSGPIPATLGQLTGLYDLILSQNNLSGSIPATFGQLTRLSSLYLGGNNLSGPIPVELAQLESISILDVDYGTGLCIPLDFPEGQVLEILLRKVVHYCDGTEPPEPPTTLTMSIAPPPMEGGDPVTVTATLDNPAPADGTTVTLATDGTATPDIDYRLSARAITIAQGQTAGTTTITVIDDAISDDGETIILDANSVNPELTARQLTITITDNDDVERPRPVKQTREECMEDAGVTGRGTGGAWDNNTGSCHKAPEEQTTTLNNLVSACRYCWALHGDSALSGQIHFGDNPDDETLLDCVLDWMVRKEGSVVNLAGVYFAAGVLVGGGGAALLGAGVFYIIMKLLRRAGYSPAQIIAMKLREWWDLTGQIESGSLIQRSPLASISRSGPSDGDWVKVQSTNPNAFSFAFDGDGELVFHYADGAQPTEIVWTLMEGDRPVASLVVPYVPGPTPVVPVLPLPALVTLGAVLAVIAVRFRRKDGAIGWRAPRAA